MLSLLADTAVGASRPYVRLRLGVVVPKVAKWFLVRQAEHDMCTVVNAPDATAAVDQAAEQFGEDTAGWHVTELDEAQVEELEL